MLLMTHAALEVMMRVIYEDPFILKRGADTVMVIQFLGSSRNELLKLRFLLTGLHSKHGFFLMTDFF